MITRWPLERTHAFDRFSKIMDDAFGGSEQWSPPADVKETPVELKFILELPGLSEKDINIEVTDHLLTVSGTRTFKDEERKDNYVRIERGYGTFTRSFVVNSLVNTDKVTATFKDGLLTITVPKVETRPAHKIPVIFG